MKNLLATILFMTVPVAGYSQKPPLKFGDVSIDEVKMTHYPADSSAAAVVLFDYGVSEINYSSTTNWFVLEFNRLSRIKILKKDGYVHADFEVAVYHNSSGKEKLIGLKVVTYNLENGKIVETKMKSDGVFTEKYDQNTDLIKFTAPNVKEGSVIEVTYTVNSDFLSYFRDWEFQSTIPVAWSEYRAYIPEYFNYDKFTQGYIGLAVNETKDNLKSVLITTKDRDNVGQVTRTTFEQNKLEYQENVSRWATKNVPAFREEPHMTTYHDYISKINFELASYKLPNKPIQLIMGTWADLNKSMLDSENFGGAVKGSGFLKKITDDVTVGLISPEEKISAIYNYVKSNIEWDGSSRKFLTDNSFKDVLEKKKGNSAHINLLLTSMLQKAGINANPVIISTRNNGFVRENMALSSQFNYVITHVAIDDKYILLDATDRLLPIHVLPERCLNGRGYMISKEQHGWVNLSQPKSKAVVSSELTLTPQGELNGQLKITTEGYHARKTRQAYLSKGESDYVKEFQHGKPFQINKSEFSNVKVLDKPVEESYELRWEEHTGGAQTVFINPIVHFNEASNPFKLEKREYPVDFGSPFEHMVMFKLTIPESYEIDEVPSSKVFRLPENGGRYLYNAQVTGNTITVTSIFTISRSLFSQNEYPPLREFYNMVVAKQAEQIALKKK